ncbi:MAG: hypothetical protein AAGA83_19900 [Cyanobacteria bacterium P01_F01_bin.116]
MRGISDDFTLLTSINSWKDRYLWKDNYQNTHWYQFQEAAKLQQTAAWGILQETSFRGLALVNL